MYTKTSISCFEINMPILNDFTEATGITFKTDKGVMNILTIYRPHKLYNCESTAENNIKLNDIIKNAPKPFSYISNYWLSLIK